MYKVHEILTPIKFSAVIIQLILTVVVHFTKSNNILNGIKSNLDINSGEFSTANNTITICLIIFYICQGIELAIILSGKTVSLNKLSVLGIRKFIIFISFLEIFFHLIGILLFSWFIWKEWGYSQIWTIWGIGGFIPLFLEVSGLLFIRNYFRKVLKLN